VIFAKFVGKDLLPSIIKKKIEYFTDQSVTIVVEEAKTGNLNGIKQVTG